MHNIFISDGMSVWLCSQYLVSQTFFISGNISQQPNTVAVSALPRASVSENTQKRKSKALFPQLTAEKAAEGTQSKAGNQPSFSQRKITRTHCWVTKDCLVFSSHRRLSRHSSVNMIEGSQDSTLRPSRLPLTRWSYHLTPWTSDRQPGMFLGKRPSKASWHSHR